MKRSSNIFSIILISMFFSCKNTDNELRYYIEEQCETIGKGNCYIDLRDALKIDYDTMYIFGEYTDEVEVSLVLGTKYKSRNLILHKPFVVEDSHYKIILTKNNKIVYEDDFEQKYSKISRGLKIDKVGTDTINSYVRMFKSPNFLVRKVEDPKGHEVKHFYILMNVQEDGSIFSRDTVDVIEY